MDRVALLLGLGCAPVAGVAARFGPESFPAGLSVLLPVLSVASLAGAIVGLHPEVSPETYASPTYAGARLGARAGWQTALLGSGMTILGTRLCGGPWAFQWLPALMSVLPGMTMGMIAGACTARLRHPPEAHLIAPAEAVPVSRFPFAFFTLVSLAIFGFLSPLFVPALFAKPPPVVAEKAKEPEPPRIDETRRVEAPPPAPPWAYVEPPELATADAARWAIMRQEPVGPVDTSLPCAFSDDGEWLAYGVQQPTGIRVIRASNREAVGLYRLDSHGVRIAFSPDSARLLVVSDGDPLSLHVWEIAADRHFVLPRPKERRVPSGALRWWAAEEVTFFLNDGPPQCLSLDTLTVYPAERSSKWSAMSADDRSKWTASLALNRFPTGGQFSHRITSYIDPDNPTTQPWNLEQKLCLGLTNPAGTYRRPLPELLWSAEDRFIPSPKRSWLAHIRGDRLEIIYFGLREPPKAVATADAAPGIDAPTQSPDLAPIIAAHKLCAFLCRPLVNPLNNRVVGPDREHVIALMRFADWKDKSATLVTAEEYSAPSPDAVLADLHTWEAGKLVPQGPSKTAEWWMPVAGWKTSAEQPVVIDGWSALERGWKIELTETNGSVSVNATAAKPTPPAPPPPTVTEAQIEAFVRTHHQKASTGDIVGLVADYAPTADYLGAKKSREAIREEEDAYQEKWSKVNESVISPIKVIRDAGVLQVRYTVEYRTENRQGSWVSGKNDLELRIVAPAAGDLQIVSQTARLYDRQSGTAAAKFVPSNEDIPTPPQPAAASHGPTWVVQAVSRQFPNIRLTDTYSMNGNRMTMRRKFTEGNGAQTLRRCTAVFTGPVRTNGDRTIIFFEKFTWATDEPQDRAFQALCEPLARADLGDRMTLVPDGKNLRALDAPVILHFQN